MRLDRMVFALALCVGLSASAPAASIGINFAGGSGDDGAPGGPILLAPGDVAGVVPQANYNNALTNAGGPQALVDSNGALSTASVSWSSSNTWGNAPPSSSADDALTARYLDGGQNAPASVTVSNIPYATYDVYVYTRREETGSSSDLSDYTVNGSTQNVQTGNLFPSQNGYVQATPDTVGNYVLFTGVTGSTMLLQADLNANNFRAPIDGLQIVDTSASPVPEPATTALVGLGAAGLIGVFARRRKS